MEDILRPGIENQRQGVNILLLCEITCFPLLYIITSSFKEVLVWLSPVPQGIAAARAVVNLILYSYVLRISLGPMFTKYTLPSNYTTSL